MTTNELSFFTSTLKIACIFSISPTNNLKAIDSKKTYLNWLLILLCLILYIWSLIGESKYYSSMNVLRAFLTILWGLCSVSCVVVTIANSNMQQKKWNEFLNNLKVVLERTKRFVKYERKCNGMILVIIAHLLYFVYVIVDGYIWSSFLTFAVYKHYIYRQITFFYISLISLLTAAVCKVITRRIEALVAILENTSRRDLFVVERKSENSLAEFFRSIGDLYGVIADVTKTYNDLFGWQILLMLVIHVVNILEKFNDIRKGLNGTYSRHIAYMSLGSASLTFLICLVVIIPCDVLVQKRLVLLRSCYRMEEELPMPSKERDEILTLIERISTQDCCFSAADFFTLDRKTVIGIFSTMTTYLIVLFQFENEK